MPAGSGTRLPADQRRRQLLDVACVPFAAGGFHGTSMDDVALAAGVTKPVLYQHFPSKRALFLAVLDDVGGRLLDALVTATGHAATGRSRVEEGFEAYFRHVTREPAAFRLLFGASVRNDPEFARVAEAFTSRVGELIAGLIRIDASREHRRVLADAIVGIAEATTRRALADPDAEHDPARLAAWLSELAWFGLRGVRAEAVEPA